MRVNFGDLLFVNNFYGNFESRLFMDCQLDSANWTSVWKVLDPTSWKEKKEVRTFR